MLPVGPVMVLPLVGSQGIRGALFIGRLHGGHRFDDADLDMAKTFANHAAVALELADARVKEQRAVLLEDRDRIARDLHDHVIQRLFAAGLTVQSVAVGPRRRRTRSSAWSGWSPTSTTRSGRSARRSSSCAGSSGRRPARCAPG